MKYFGNKEDSLKLGLSFCLLLGSVLGTLFCNRMTGEMKQELMILGQSPVTQVMLEGMDRYDLLIRILPKRIWTLIVVMLAATTPVAVWCMRFEAGYVGFSNAVIVCILTMESGVKGLLRYILLIFPQCLCYIPIGYLLMWWMPAKEKRFTVASVLFLLVLVCMGCLLESLVNPMFLSWF